MRNRAALRFWALGLFLTGLLLRVVHVATVRDAPLFSHLFIDPELYDAWGRQIAGGEWLSPAPFFLDPLYPYFVGAVYRVLGDSLVSVAIVQSLLGAAVAPLLYLAARRFTPEWTARIAGLFAVFYPPAIYQEGLLMKPALSLFLVAAALAVAAAGFEARRPLAWLGCGLLLGAAGLLRGNILLIVPLLAAGIAFREDPSPRGENRRRLVADALLMMVGTAIVLIPTTWHNWTVGGEWIPAVANHGQIFYIGNNPTNPSGEYQQLPFVDPQPRYEQRDFKAEAERRAGHPLTHRQVSRFWLLEGLHWVRAEPFGFVRGLWFKTRSLWGAYEIPDSVDYYLYRQSAPLLRLPFPGFGLLGPLALVGMALSLRQRSWLRFLLLFVVAYSLSIVVFFVFTRFRMAMMPALFVFAAIGLVEGGRRLLSAGNPAGRSAAIRVAVLFLASFLFVNFPVRANVETWTYRVAHGLGLPTRAESSAKGRFNLGVTYASLAADSETPTRLLESARVELERSVQLGPESDSFQELGKVLARLDLDHEAIEAYRSAVELRPEDFRSHHALGLLRRRTGDAALAEAAFRQALALSPGFAPSAVQLGELMLEQGRPAEATAAFRHALKIRPDDARALAGLAEVGGLEPP